MRSKSYDEAEETFTLGYSLAKICGVPWLSAEHANYAGLVRIQKGQFEAAFEWLNKAADLSLEIGSPNRIGIVHLNRGIALYKSGRYSRCIEDLETSVTHLSQSNDKVNNTRAHIALANVKRLTRDFPAARSHLMTAYTMATDLAIPREECLALEFLGDVYRDEDRPDEALRYYQRALAIGERIAPEGDLVMEILRRQGECLIMTGKPGEGLELLAQARAKARKLGDRFEEGVIMRCLGNGLLQTGHLHEALDYATRSVDLLESIDARHEHAISRMVAAEVLLAMSDDRATAEPRDRLDEAWRHGLVALGIFRTLDIEHWNNAINRLQSRLTRRRAEEARYAPKGTDDGAPSLDQVARDVVIAESRTMKETLQAIEAFAPHREPILLTGETGTGKEVLARLAHRQSARADRPFMAVNVPAIPHTMFEREFFGNVRGAFSGAESDRKGLAAAADGGTLFLDEIGDLPLDAQAKLLRLLQEGTYHCLGDPAERRTDLRVIAATNCDLEEAVRSRRFREDLYFRLATLVVPIVPLRQRREDIRPLLDHFLSQSAGRKVTADAYFNDVSLRLLEHYDWPGNAREVALVARRAFISQHTIGEVEVVAGVGEQAIVLRGRHHHTPAVVMAANESSNPTSRARIMLALEEADGNRSEAARRLGVSRATLYRKLAQFKG